MCLALLVPKGVSKNTDFLFDSIRTASTTNRDGMGYAHKSNKDNRVYLSKGYTEVEDIINELRSRDIKDDDELIVHLRIGNKGSVNTDMCHPFVASTDEEEVIINNMYADKPVFIHNGTLFKYSVTGSKYSDTYFFARDFLSNKNVQNFLRNSKEDFEKYFKDHISTSRFAVLFPNTDQEAVTIGSFTEDNGIFFSNDSYKDYRVRNIGGVNYYGHDYAVCDYDGFDYDDDYYNGFGNDYSVRSAVKSKRTRVKNTLKDIAIRASNVNLRSEYLGINVPLVTNNIFISPFNDETYRRYMGLYIPKNKLATNSDAIIEVNELNYTHLEFIDDGLGVNKSVEKFRTYIISSYNMSGGEDKDNIIHSFSMFTGSSMTPVYVYDSDIYRTFEVEPFSYMRKFYDSYIELVQKVQISKNKIKKLTKTLNNDTKDEIHYEKIGYFSREVLQLFLFNMYKELYPSNYRERFAEKTCNQLVKN